MRLCTFAGNLFVVALLLTLNNEFGFAQNKYKTLLVPEFYHPLKQYDGDTTYESRCYDKRDTLLTNWGSFEEVGYVSVFKNYNDPTHTYYDGQGKAQPIPLSVIVNRYDRVSKTKWLHIDYTRHTYTDLVEDKNIIVKTDTMPATNPSDTIMVYKYYKTGS